MDFFIGYGTGKVKEINFLFLYGLWILLMHGSTWKYHTRHCCFFFATAACRHHPKVSLSFSLISICLCYFLSKTPFCSLIFLSLIYPNLSLIQLINKIKENQNKSTSKAKNFTQNWTLGLRLDMSRKIVRKRRGNATRMRGRRFTSSGTQVGLSWWWAIGGWEPRLPKWEEGRWKSSL